MKIIHVYAAALIAAAVSASCSGTSDITMETLLDEMVSRDAVTYFPEQVWSQKQASSYDRRSVSPDAPGWFANRDWTGYERIDTVAGHVEKVLMEWHGPGAIDRIWMTTKGKRGTMRFYFDGADEPAITIPAYDMKLFPLDVPEALSLTHTHYQTDIDGVGGNTFFLPIPFAEGCRVTFEEESPEADNPRYFHINWRAYAPGTKVRTYTHAEAESLLPKMREVSELLFHPKEAEGSHVATIEELAPGECLELALPEGTNAVRGLCVRTSGYEDYGTSMEWLRIRGNFDGAQCIDAVLSEFFGAGFGTPDVDGDRKSVV